MRSNRSHSRLDHQEVEEGLVVAMVRHLRGRLLGQNSFRDASRIRSFRHRRGLVPMGQHRYDHGVRSRHVYRAAPVHVAAMERRPRLEREAHVVAKVCGWSLGRSLQGLLQYGEELRR